MTAASTPQVHLQVAEDLPAAELPGDDEFAAWASAALAAGQAEPPDGCITLRIVSAEESAALNSDYRDKAGPTNILAFPAGAPVLPAAAAAEPELGDLVICLQVASDEAAAQGKPLARHLAHLTVHGTLHLLGHDHQDEAEAEQMEALETLILAGLGISDPYAASSEDAGQNSNN